MLTLQVLTTPDAQRSFLSFFTSDAPQLTPQTMSAICSARMVVIEGYMLELPGSAAWARDVILRAKACGAQVALTAGDPSVVKRHRETIKGLIDMGLDIMFANSDEARALMDVQEAECSGREAASHLGSIVPVAVVTDGSKGSYISALGEVLQVPRHPAPKGAVDVCGAGDAYAAGMLFCLCQGYDLKTAGGFGSKVAAVVVGRHGAQLTEEDAASLVALLPEHNKMPGYMTLGQDMQQLQ